MIGLALLGLLVVWLVVVGFITSLIFRGAPRRWWRPALLVLVPIVLISLPLADEIIGGIQFRRLCSEHSEIHVDRAKARGRTVYLAMNPDQEAGVMVPTRILPFRYLDAATDELVLSYDYLYAKGGWLARAIPVETSEPLTFKGSCVPGGRAVDAIKLFKELGVQQIQRSELPPKGGRL